ncbi:uncharacterized protein [Anoplolepis gracilipes]|uniref:uncharacterized protein n=1 Tax=Anoplolepis gracilipes TaxID=354296 RepID=UPI003B9DEF91
MEGKEEAEIESGEMTEEEKEEEEEEEIKKEEEEMREVEKEAEDEEEEEEENDINDVSMIEEVQIGGGRSGEIQRQQDQHQQVRVGEEENHSHADKETLDAVENEPDRREEKGVYTDDQVENNFRSIVLLSENVRQFRNFGIEGREISFRIRPISEGANVYNWLENAFRELHTYVTRSCVPGYYVGMTFDSGNFMRGPAGISFRPFRDLTYENIWNFVSSLAQSCDGHDIALAFNIRVSKVTPPQGRGRNALTRDIIVKLLILTISNSDNLCLPRALVSAQIFNEHGNLRTRKLHEKWNAVRRQNSVLQRDLALQLTRNAGVTIPEEGSGIPEIERFQQYFARDNIAIVIYNIVTFGRGGKPLYNGVEFLASLQRETRTCLNYFIRT